MCSRHIYPQLMFNIINVILLMTVYKTWLNYSIFGFTHCVLDHWIASSVALEHSSPLHPPPPPHPPLNDQLIVILYCHPGDYIFNFSSHTWLTLHSYYQWILIEYIYTTMLVAQPVDCIQCHRRVKHGHSALYNVTTCSTRSIGLIRVKFGLNTNLPNYINIIWKRDHSML